MKIKELLIFHYAFFSLVFIDFSSLCGVSMIHFDSSSAWYFIFTIFYFEHRDRILSCLVTEESNAQAYPFVDSDKNTNNQLGASIEEKYCIQNSDCKEFYITFSKLFRLYLCSSIQRECFREFL